MTTVDYNSLPSLTSALSSQDAVVSTIATAAISAQVNLVHAGGAAGVKRFIPSEFGSNTLNHRTAALPCFKDKIAVQEALKQEARDHGMTYTLICTGPFLDWGIQVGFIMNLKARSIELYDGGDRLFSTSTLGTIGESVAAVLQHPEQTENRAVYVQDTAKTLKEFAEMGKKATGGAAGWKENVVQTERLVEGATAELKKGNYDPMVFLEFIKASIWGEGYGGFFEKTDNEVLAIREKSAAELQAIVDGLAEK